MTPCSNLGAPVSRDLRFAPDRRNYLGKKSLFALYRKSSTNVDFGTKYTYSGKKTDQPKMGVQTSRESFSASFSTLVKSRSIAPTYFSMGNPFPIDLCGFEQSIYRISSNKFH